MGLMGLVRIAAIQMTSNHEVAPNLKTVEKWIHKAAEFGANCILLPENFAYMGMQETDKLKIAETFGDGPIQSFLGQLSKLHEIWLIAGTLPLRSEEAGAGTIERVTDQITDHITNQIPQQMTQPPDQITDRVTATTLVFNPQGQCVTRYDKIHLFDVEVDNQESHAESRTVMPGRKVVALATPFATLGLTICYDLRFPELYRKLFNTGVEVFVVPSAFTQKTGEAHWEILLRARAIENFSYVVAANQTGIHSNGRATFGHSMIIDPWGKVIDCLPNGEGLVMADINLTYLQDIRRRFPVLEHQRIGKDN